MSKYNEKRKKQQKYVIAVLCQDRPGIVANLTGTILKLGGIVDMMSQTVVEGYFTILITAELPAQFTPEFLQKELERAGRALQISATVQVTRELPASARMHEPNIYFLTLVARENKQVVHEVSSYLAAQGINIVDLYCFPRGAGELLVISEVDIPTTCDISQIQIDLEALGARTDLSVRLQHENLFLATNNLYLSRQAEVPWP